MTQDRIPDFMGTIGSNAISAAEDVYAAICTVNGRHHRKPLLSALHRLLIIAEQARQAVAAADEAEEQRILRADRETCE